MSKRTLIGVPIILTVLVAAGAVAFPYVYQNRSAVLQNQFVHYVVPMYHSVRKIPDLLYMPYALVHQSELEKYELFIPEKQLMKLNEALDGQNPFAGLLLDENKVWVDAEFRAPGYVDNVEVKYRGQLANHWNSYKKSYTIEFPKNNLFRGMREMRLIIPYDRAYFGESLNNYRARKLGQVVPKDFFVRLSVNGGTEGVMLASEHWSQAWVEKLPVSSLSKIYGIGVTDSSLSMYSTDDIAAWKSWNADLDDGTPPELRALIRLTEDATDEEFKALAPLLIDLESFYAKDIVLLLTGGYHSSADGNNIVLFFDATEGRFKTIPYNAGLSDIDRPSTPSFPRLQERIYRIPAFRQALDERLAEYVADQTEDDLAFIDETIEFLRPEFYLDNAMLHNNFMFNGMIEDFKQASIHHLTTATTDVLYENSSLHEVPAEELSQTDLVLPESFRPLPEAALSSNEFARRHHQFSLVEEKLVLRRGAHVFSEDVIIPRNTSLIIEPGAILRFTPDTSLISWSPIIAEGTKELPIKITGTDRDRPWGSVAVINTDADESRLEYVSFENGSEEHMNGVWFSGMVAFHNADVSVASSTFINVQGEDGLNVKGGQAIIANNLFATTTSDGIDLDYVADTSTVVGNEFQNIKGDAIDVSWVDLAIENNVVTGCVDKGISMGESSIATISKNEIKDCDMGVAVKDSSEVKIVDNILIDNRIAVAAYQKKEFFGGGEVTLLNNSYVGNEQQFLTDELSQIIEE